MIPSRHAVCDLSAHAHYQNPEFAKSKADIAQLLTVVPSRVSDDLVVVMHAKVVRALALDPEDFPAFPLEGAQAAQSDSSPSTKRSKKAGADRGTGSKSQPSTSLATVPESVVKKTSAFRDKLRKLLCEGLTKRRKQLKKENSAIFRVACPVGRIAELVEAAAHARYPFASAKTPSHKSARFKNAYAQGLSNIVRAIEESKSNNLALRLLMLKPRPPQRSDAIDPSAMVRVMGDPKLLEKL